MIEIKGKHNTAVCYCRTLEETAASQIKTVCDQPAFSDTKIRIMPDVHAGKGCTIGTTMTITDKIVPSMVGVDIGCGMETTRIKETEIDFEKLDALIRKEIPCGFEIRNTPHPLLDKINLKEFRCFDQINLYRAECSIGTLGGGNHFIEIDRSEEGELYLVVHSGSRHLGNEVAKYYQEEAASALCGHAKFQINILIEQMKAEGRQKEIQQTIKELKKQNAIPFSKELAYVEGILFNDYIHDMKLAQKYAVLNRKAMTDVIISGMGWTIAESFTTIHNYIETENMILRKGAVSAQKGEKLLIPINMRDGSLICIGKGNPDWNCSAPHGAGRLMSRKQAYSQLSMETYQKEMDGIFSTCITPETLDESPMAYKNIEEIISQISPTAEIVKQIRPIYNFKASEI